ncbi:unnamed protein product, partial [Rotaria sp. Silwood2]
LLHERFVCKILHQARDILKALPNSNEINLSQLHHVYIVGDLHGQLADLLHIFNQNGLPATDNPYLFNGDFVDRGANSVEVFLLLMVALITSPSSVFLNRAIIRSHQVKEKGYELQHGGKLITIFSASNYQGHSNFGAVLQWFEFSYDFILNFMHCIYPRNHNATQPWIKSYKAQSIDMNKLSFNKRVTLLEDPAYQSIIEKIFENKTSLQREFANADPTQTGISSLIVRRL